MGSYGNVNCLWRRNHNLYSLYHNHHCLLSTCISTSISASIMGKNKVKNHKNSKSGTPSPSSKPKSELPNSNSNSDLNSDPNSDHSPTNLGTQVPLTIKQTNLDNPSQTLLHETSQSSPLVRIAEALNDIKADNKEFKVNSAQNTETLKKHSLTLTTHATSLAALFETQNKQNLEINQLKESNSTLAQNLLDQTLRITHLEKTIEVLINTTEKLTSRNQILQTSVDDLMT